MTLETIAGFAEEATRHCKEFAAFLRERQRIERDYGQELAELCQKYLRSAWDVSNTREGRAKAAAADPTNLKAQLLSMSVWKSVFDIVDRLHKIADAHTSLSSAIGLGIVDPFETQLKEMDTARKHANRGRKFNRDLQDAYTEFSRAKQEFDVSQVQASETIDSLAKAQLNATSKRKELEKLQQKATQALERAAQTAESLRDCEVKRNAAQQEYFTKRIPALHKEIQEYETQRHLTVKKILSELSYLDKGMSETRTAMAKASADSTSDIDVEKDITIFVKLHLVAEDKDSNTVSVRGLLNPLKAGRVLVRRGDNAPGWSSSYLVLMSEERLLYFFDREDSEKPREVISLGSNCQVYSVDDSYFGRANCLQLIIDLSQNTIPDASTSPPTPTFPSAAANRVPYNIIAESANDKSEWISALRHFCYCCAKCAQVYGWRAPSGNAVTATADLGSAGVDGHNLARSLQLWVMEAKELQAGGKGANPYCVVLFNDVKQARTSAKSGDSVFWGEEFRFSHTKSQRDAEIGYVSINLSTLRTGKKVEEWYQIKPFQKSNVEVAGTVRIAYILSNDQSLPMNLYQEFLEVVTEPSLTCVRYLSGLITHQREEFAKTLLNVLVAHNRDVEGVKTLTRHEILSTDDPHIIFRGNSLATKVLDQYMKLVGMDYLHSTLTSLIRGVYTSKDNCEVDPNKLPQGKETDLLKRNWKRLLNQVTIFWEAIQRSADRMPAECTAVFSDIAVTAMDKFKEERVKYSAVSGFIFLRFFCPAILSPKLFGIMSEHPDPTTSRTLTFIAKILQNLANLSEFEGKEPHMAPSNTWIAEHKQTMKTFLDQISTPSETSSNPPTTSKPRIDLRRESALLHQYFSEKLGEIKSNKDAATDPHLARLIPVMEELEAAKELASNTMTSATPTSAGGPEDPTLTSLGHSREGLYASDPLLLTTAIGGDTESVMMIPKSRQGSRQGTDLAELFTAPVSTPSSPTTPVAPMGLPVMVGETPPRGKAAVLPSPRTARVRKGGGSGKEGSSGSGSGGGGGSVGGGVEHFKDFVRGLGSSVSHSSPLQYQSYHDGLLSNAIAAVDDEDFGSGSVASPRMLNSSGGTVLSNTSGGNLFDLRKRSESQSSVRSNRSLRKAMSVFSAADKSASNVVGSVSGPALAESSGEHTTTDGARPKAISPASSKSIDSGGKRDSHSDLETPTTPKANKKGGNPFFRNRVGSTIKNLLTKKGSASDITTIPSPSPPKDKDPREKEKAGSKHSLTRWKSKGSQTSLQEEGGHHSRSTLGWKRKDKERERETSFSAVPQGSTSTHTSSSSKNVYTTATDTSRGGSLTDLTPRASGGRMLSAGDVDG
ncbi:Ras GTPase-activating protein 1, partial [Borealophlyctis nickersoniae]